MTGFTRMPKLNLLEREMRNLNLQYYDLYRRDPNELVDRLIREELSGEEFSVNLNQRLADVITRDPSYLNLKSNAEKRNYLKRYAKRNVYNSPDEKQLGAREVALNKLDTLADDYDLPYSENDIRNYRKLSKQERDAIDAEFRNLLKEKEFILNGEETADNLLIDSFSILNTRDLDMINPDTDDRINVLQWALTRKGVSETLREKGIMSKRKRKP
jgi:hypothetical protein